MKLWVALTILLYLVCLSIIVVPLCVLATAADYEEVLAIFYYWFVPVLVLAQGVLLLVPVGDANERPIKRRGIIVSALIAAIPMAALMVAFFYSTALMIWGEHSVSKYSDHYPALIALAVFWLFWGTVFVRGYSDSSQTAFTSRITRWLLRGSILELVVAVPSHIISRHRNECCAPEITLLGIAMGLATALMSFGPGVFFLFAQRIRNKKGGLGKVKS
jgi:hypothetical protein